MLRSFKKRYELFFFILKYDHKRTREISENEIHALEPFGRTEIYVQSAANPQKRAKALKDFISSHR